MGDPTFCEHFIEIPGDQHAGTTCKLRYGHDGDHRAHYPTALGAQPCDVMGGDGSIPGPVCVLPTGHEGPHYG